jgi:hypothetical protein
MLLEVTEFHTPSSRPMKRPSPHFCTHKLEKEYHRARGTCPGKGYFSPKDLGLIYCPNSAKKEAH